MRIVWLAGLVAALGLGCAHATGERPAVAAGEPPDAALPTLGRVDVDPFVPEVWLHRSTSHVEGFGEVSSNGLVVASEEGALLVDTAWTPAQTAQLLDWIDAHVGEVQAVLVTHWHADRSGGLAEVHRRGIPSYGHVWTAAEAEQHGTVAPSHTFGDVFDLRALGVRGEVFFPGPGHSLDNVVVWLPAADVLFGGCLVKAAEATDLGNVADGDLRAWPESIARTRRRYPSPARIVPGHGVPGDASLLTHTFALLTSRGR